MNQIEEELKKQYIDLHKHLFALEDEMLNLIVDANGDFTEAWDTSTAIATTQLAIEKIAKARYDLNALQ